MMFYNGFNLLIDVIIAGAVCALTYRHAYLTGYFDGEQDTLAHEIKKGRA